MDSSSINIDPSKLKEIEEAAENCKVGDDEIKKFKKLLKKAKRICIFTGAGISAESGISTFRAPDVGIWANKFGLALFGTPFGWWSMPSIAWKVYMDYFRGPISKARPNLAHISLAHLPQLLSLPSENYLVVTQNVDGLHQRGGTPDDHVAELHGTIYRHVCSKNHHVQSYALNPRDIESTGYSVENDRYFYEENGKIAYPRCDQPNCKSYLRPDAVLFTESLPNEPWRKATEFISKLRKGDLLIIVGTSGVVYPAASLPSTASFNKVSIVDINPEKSAFSDMADLCLFDSSSAVLSKLFLSFLPSSPLNNNNNNNNNNEIENDNNDKENVINNDENTNDDSRGFTLNSSRNDQDLVFTNATPSTHPNLLFSHDASPDDFLSINDNNKNTNNNNNNNNLVFENKENKIDNNMNNKNLNDGKKGDWKRQSKDDFIKFSITSKENTIDDEYNDYVTKELNDDIDDYITTNEYGVDNKDKSFDQYHRRRLTHSSNRNNLVSSTNKYDLRRSQSSNRNYYVSDNSPYSNEEKEVNYKSLEKSSERNRPFKRSIDSSPDPSIDLPSSPVLRIDEDDKTDFRDYVTKENNDDIDDFLKSI